jgi:putative alpha-1,2-mannosidase
MGKKDTDMYRNEPDFQTPYLYNYINKQWKSVKRSRALARQ